MPAVAFDLEVFLAFLDFGLVVLAALVDFLVEDFLFDFVGEPIVITFAEPGVGELLHCQTPSDKVQALPSGAS